MYKNNKNQGLQNQFQEHMQCDKFKETKISNKHKSEKKMRQLRKIKH